MRRERDAESGEELEEHELDWPREGEEDEVEVAAAVEETSTSIVTSFSSFFASFFCSFFCFSFSLFFFCGELM